ncbi:Hypothetical predicted protein [Cloeon dipterum]|uniref:Uncharacterized protein n=1 Tax=Cloeon dipterum TaxID=197152 RepID=A0A8S1DVE4_9INSE|nr:Hypothetical predicted protein [Cloeon dipterum]
MCVTVSVSAIAALGSRAGHEAAHLRHAARCPSHVITLATAAARAPPGTGRPAHVRPRPDRTPAPASDLDLALTYPGRRRPLPGTTDCVTCQDALRGRE